MNVDETVKTKEEQKPKQAGAARSFGRQKCPSTRANRPSVRANRPSVRANRLAPAPRSPEEATKQAALRARGDRLTEALWKLYPEAVCALAYEGEPWKLMVMGRLSAQCTDKRVNEVCLALFARFPTAKALAYASIPEVEALIRPCGLFHVKAADIVGECRMLTEEFGGKLPDNMDDLLRFPGVGRKIANLLLGDIFHKPGIVADTHCIRIAGRLGFYPEANRDPLKTEKILSGLIAPEKQSDFCHRMVQFGRDFCRAQNPACDLCPLAGLCDSESKRKSQSESEKKSQSESEKKSQSESQSQSQSQSQSK